MVSKPSRHQLDTQQRYSATLWQRRIATTAAMAEKKPKDFYASEPIVPKWVMDLVGVDTK